MAIISLMEFIESAASSTVCDNTINGECCQCGECCGNYLPLSKKEIRAIHQYIKANDIKECNNMVPLSEVLFDLTCPFLDTRKSNEKCRIYEVRPEICKVFACNKT
ncbi:MAG: YkgJ family cysteine cluster protein, partial [Lachnospiraceae bacterium]|nr:YkgJ family cysteine cluster protein [Lachnospiraceae bacterium]